MTSEKQLGISAARSLTPCLRLHSSLLPPPTPLGASPGVGSPRGGGGRRGGAAAPRTAEWNPRGWEMEWGMGSMTPRSKNRPLTRGPERWPSACPCVLPPPTPRYSPVTPGAGSRSETGRGHSPAPPLRPAPPFRALQPRRISQRSSDCREEAGGGEGEVPRGAVCRARPSLPGVPAGNHEWEPREAPTLLREPSGPRLHFPPWPLGVTATARLSRPGSPWEARASTPGSARTRAA